MKRVAVAAMVTLVTGCSTSAAQIRPDPEADGGAPAEASTEAPDAPAPEAGPTPADAGSDAPTGPGGGLTYTSVSTTCGQSYTVGAVTYWYAEQLYPGATADELASVTAFYTYAPNAGGGVVPGYARQSVPTQVKDGAVAVNCGASQGLGVVFVRGQ